MSVSKDEAVAVMAEADCLFDRAEVERACDRISARINSEMAGGDIVVLCIMNGGLVATGLLLPRLDLVLKVDYMHVSRYREKTSGADLHWKVEPSNELRGKDVLIVDDILDEGYTLEAIIQFVRGQGPASVRTAVLVQKEHNRGVRPPVEYVGLRVPDRYVFGYGMDFKGYWRNAPGIFAVAPPPET